MRLTRLRAKCEVRRTADSANTRSGGQACPEPKAVPEQGRMGWLETECPEVRVQKPRRPVLDADAGSPRQGRSQSVHSSEEASNDRGAKGHRKLVGARTVEGYKRSSIVPKRLCVLEPQRPPETELLSKGPRQREHRTRSVAGMGQSSVCHVRVSPFRSDQRLESRMPETGLSGLEGGTRFKPSSLPLSIPPRSPPTFCPAPGVREISQSDLRRKRRRG